MKYLYAVLQFDLPEYYSGSVCTEGEYDNPEEAFSKKKELESKNTNEYIFYEVVVSEQYV